ncbi:hypothetical protein D3C86_1474710 [compost metagenome]
MQGGIQPEVVAELPEADGGDQQQQERGQGETRKGGERPSKACPMATDGEAELAGGRAGQQLAQGQQLGKLGLAEPALARDEGALEVADMGGRPTEADTAQPQKLKEYLPHRSLPCCHWIWAGMI